MLPRSGNLGNELLNLSRKKMADIECITVKTKLFDGPPLPSKDGQKVSELQVAEGIDTLIHCWISDFGSCCILGI